MANWKDLLDETRAAGAESATPFDATRRKYLKRYAQLTGRNVIVYYSGWLQKPELERRGAAFGLNDADKHAFMASLHRLDRAKGLDLFLHTPGGDLAAAESLADYLRRMFGTNVRAVVPQVAMSAGTMLALSCKQVVMGAHSSIGPLDPRVGPGLSSHFVIEEFEAARREMKADPAAATFWQAVLSKHAPGLVGEAVKARQWARTLVHGWLVSGMLAARPDADAVASKVVEYLSEHAPAVSPDRHVSAERARGLGVVVAMLEDAGQEKFQDAVLSVHNACVQTLAYTDAVKLVENQLGVGVVTAAPKAAAA